MPKRAAWGDSFINDLRRINHCGRVQYSLDLLAQFVGRNDLDGIAPSENPPADFKSPTGTERELDATAGKFDHLLARVPQPLAHIRRLLRSEAENDIYGILPRNAKRVLSAFLGIKCCVHFKLRFRNNHGEQAIDRQGGRPRVFWHASYYVEASTDEQ